KLATKFVIDTREKCANLCNDLKLPRTTWESYVQHLIGLYRQQQ
ncbi:unnamed protein product, partial [Rotaria sordida]